MLMTTIRHELYARGWTPREVDGSGWLKPGGAGDTTILPGRYIPDRARRQAMRVDLREIMPDGAHLTAGDEAAVVEWQDTAAPIFVLIYQSGPCAGERLSVPLILMQTWDDPIRIALLDATITTGT